MEAAWNPKFASVRIGSDVAMTGTGGKQTLGRLRRQPMELVVHIFLAAIALWSAHVAGAAYVLSKSDPSKKLSAVLRTVFSIIAIGVLVFVR